jgi:hypothetical protein
MIKGKWANDETSFKLSKLSKRMPSESHSLTSGECSALIKDLFDIIVTLSKDIEEIKGKQND